MEVVTLLWYQTNLVSVLFDINMIVLLWIHFKQIFLFLFSILFFLIMSTVYVGMAWNAFQLQAHGDELKSRALDISLNTHISLNSECFYDYQDFLDLCWSRELASGKAGWMFIISRFFSRQIILLNEHDYFSTIPVAFIVKFWSTSVNMISSGTTNKECFNHCINLIYHIDKCIH